MASAKGLPSVFNPQPRDLGAQRARRDDIATVRQRAQPRSGRARGDADALGPILTALSRLGCKGKQDRAYVGIFVSFVLLCSGAIFRVALGGWALSMGETASVLALEDRLHWAGVCAVINGACFLVIAIFAARSALLTLAHGSLTCKGVRAVATGMLYLLIVDIVAIIFASGPVETTFESKIRSGMQRTLANFYVTDRNAAVTRAWDNLQANSACCGVDSYLDWSSSAWISNIAAEGGILPLSCALSPTNGPCQALTEPIISTEDGFIAFVELTPVSVCDQAGNGVYVSAQPCGDIYVRRLTGAMDLMATLMISVASVTFACVALKFCCARFLLRTQRVTSVYTVANNEITHPQAEIDRTLSIFFVSKQDANCRA